MELAIFRNTISSPINYFFFSLSFKSFFTTNGMKKNSRTMASQRIDSTMIDPTKAFELSTAVLFLAYSLSEYSFLESHNQSLPENEKNAIRFSAMLLLIAGFHYAVLTVSDLSASAKMLVRYSDWFFTTPLILLSLLNLLDVDSRIRTEILGLNLVMIVTGFIHEIAGSVLWWAVGSVAFGRMLMLLQPMFQQSVYNDLFYSFLVFGWAPYGVAAIFPESDRSLVYGPLDLYNKLFLAMAIRKRVAGHHNNTPNHSEF